jgi:peptidoglycan/LPS O-acetylase OafA/YrhL
MKNFTLGNKGDQTAYFLYFYSKPWTRIAPYLVGIFFCELFIAIPKENKDIENKAEHQSFNKINLTLKNNKFVVTLLFCVSMIFLIYSLFIRYFVNNYEESFPNGLMMSFMVTFDRQVFVLGFGIILHLCFLGYFEMLKNFLNLTIFSFIAKVSYGIFMLHFLVVFPYFYSLGYSMYFRFSDMFFLAFAMFIWLIPISLFFGVLFESPTIRITKLILGN